MKIIVDKTTIKQYKIDEVTGFLKTKVVLARTGIQKYIGHEIGLSDNMTYNVYRDASEVMRKTTLDSFNMMPFVNGHEEVTIANIKNLQIGTVANIEKKGNFIEGSLIVTDKNAIDEIINSKKREVSVGYSAVIEKFDKDINGIHCEFMQKDIIGNHLALVDKGRCGKDCKVLIDKKGDIMKTIQIKGITYQIDDDGLLQAVNGLKTAIDEFEKKEKSSEEDEEKKKKEADEKEKEIEALKKTNDSLQAQIDVAKKKNLSMDEINKIVDEKILVIEKARKVLTDEEIGKCKTCTDEMKILVIEKAGLGDNIKDKSTDYINATFDLLTTRLTGLDNISTALKDATKTSTNDSRETARQKYIDRLTKSD